MVFEWDYFNETDSWQYGRKPDGFRMTRAFAMRFDGDGCVEYEAALAGVAIYVLKKRQVLLSVPMSVLLERDERWVWL